MKHAETSLAAYLQIQPKLGPLQQTVYTFIKQNPDSTDKEISEQTGIAINVVTPRRGELAAQHLIFSCGTKRQSNGYKAKTWRTVK